MNRTTLEPLILGLLAGNAEGMDAGEVWRSLWPAALSQETVRLALAELESAGAIAGVTTRRTVCFGRPGEKRRATHTVRLFSAPLNARGKGGAS